MKTYILFILLLMSFYIPSIAQDGKWETTAIRVELNGDYSRYQGNINTLDWGAPYNGPSKGTPVYYQVVVPDTMNLLVHNLGSTIYGTEIDVYNKAVGIQRSIPKAAYYDYLKAINLWKEHEYLFSQDCYIIRNLAPGRYYITVRGIVVSNAGIVNGDIRTTIVGWKDKSIHGLFPLPDYIVGEQEYPKDLGNITNKKLINDSISTKFQRNTFGSDGIDVYYKFSLSKKMAVNILVPQPNTITRLLDSSRNILSTSNQPVMTDTLEAGTYIIIVETDSKNDIVTLGLRTNMVDELPSPTPSEKEEPHDTIVYDRNLLMKYNFTKEREYTSADGSTFREKVVYYDGLGRPVEERKTKESPTGSDIVSYREYDSMGNIETEWLPTIGRENTFCTKNEFLDLSKELYEDPVAYSNTFYENTPDCRPLVKFNSGEDWRTQKKGLYTEYLLNSEKEESLKVFYYTAEASDNDILITCHGCYSDSELTGVKATDEDGNPHIEFKNPLEQTVLQRTILNGENVDTYYVYDDYGNLCAVLPTSAASQMQYKHTWNSDADFLKKYAYLYLYDDRNRNIAKRLPGCDWLRNVYDDADQLIFSQDGNMRKRGEWLFTIPDMHDRKVVSGICKNPMDISDKVVYAERSQNDTIYKGYKIYNLSFDNPKILNVCYYDDYSFMGKNGIPDSLSGFGYEENQTYNTRHSSAKTMRTGTLTAVLSSDSCMTGTYLYSVVYYDIEGHPVQVVESKQKGGYIKNFIAYDFVGKPKSSVLRHVLKDSDVMTEIFKNDYDNAGRLLKTTYSLNNGEEIVLANNEYDELGRLKNKSVSNDKRISTEYSYNIRSWVTNISNPLFSEKLYYNERHGGNTPQYGGNISAMEWKVNSGNVSDALRGYNFLYDGLSRLVKADYQENGTSSDHYGTSYTYDAMGNILSLHRNGLHNNNTFDEIDNLTYTYDGNQLIKVDDVAQDPIYKDCFDFKDSADEDIEYEYDANGNITKDLNRQICNIEYNYLNLPCRVEFLDGSKVLYTYDANGTKLRIDYYINPMTAVVPQTSNVQGVSSITDLRHTWVDYCSNFIYENDTLKQTLIGGGYISYVYSQGVTQPTPVYHFYVQDHLGNNRLVLNENGTIEQVNHYYPYGGLMGESKNISSNQRYKYNGKEFDRMHGLDWYDYGARLFNSALCRFTTVDPLATKYYGVDPYVFCGNNPVKNIDWNGMDYWSTSDRREIAAFCNQMKDNDGGGGTFHYDFSNWNHLTDDQFFSTGFYNDKTNKFYVSWGTVKNGEPVCISESFSVYVDIDRNIESKPFDATSAFYDVLDEKYRECPVGFKSKAVYDTKKVLNTKFNIKIPYSNSYIYRTAIPNALKNVGRGLTAVDLGINVLDVYNNTNIRASNVLDLTMCIAGFTPYGWAIGAGYFLMDNIVTLYTGQGIGTHLNRFIGNDGVIVDF